MGDDGRVSAPRPAGLSRRTLVLSAALLAGAIIVGVTLVAVLADPGTPDDPATSQTYDDGAPRIIARPNSGTAPKDVGDRGGAAQLALLGLVVVSVVGIGLVVAKGGGAKARRSRNAWHAAAASDHDGAIDP